MTRPNGYPALCKLFMIPYAELGFNKVAVYQKHTHTQKQIFITLVTSGGLKPTFYSEELITQHVGLEDLFKE